MTDLELKMQVRRALDASMPPLPEDPLLTDKVLGRDAEAQQSRRRQVMGLRVAVALAVVVLIVCSGLLVPWETIRYLDTHQSDDGKLFISQGVVVTPPGGSSNAHAQLPEEHHEEGSLVTTDLDEAIEFWGSDFRRPTWAPKGWHPEQYTLTFLPTLSVCHINFLNPALYDDYFIIFNAQTLYELESLYIETDQDDFGHYVDLPNGLSVYVLTRGSDKAAIWLDGGTRYLAAGPITEDELLHMVYSAYDLDWPE